MLPTPPMTPSQIRLTSQSAVPMADSPACTAGAIRPWIRYSIPSPSQEPNGPKVVQNMMNMKNAKIGSAHTRCSTIASMRSDTVILCTFGRLKQARTTSSI